MSSSRMHTPDLHDYIGGESCLDLAPDFADSSRTTTAGRRQRWRRGHAVEEKEYPPPIQRLPWVLRKYTTSDGRVLIKEEKADRQPYIRAHRYNGRLLLDLVHEKTSSDEDEEENEAANNDLYAYSEMGVNPCAGFGVRSAFGPAVRT